MKTLQTRSIAGGCGLSNDYNIMNIFRLFKKNIIISCFILNAILKCVDVMNKRDQFKVSAKALAHHIKNSMFAKRIGINEYTREGENLITGRNES